MTRRNVTMKQSRGNASIAGRAILFVILVSAVAALIALAAPRSARASCYSAKMQALAQEHSNDMARRNSLDHGEFASRAARGARAENVAYGYKTEAQTIAQWWRSPGHAANMRLSGCRAVAHAVSASGRWYWTMEIGE